MRSDFPKNATWALATIRTPDGPLGCVETAAGLYPLASLDGLSASDVAGLFEDWTGNAARIDAAVAGLSAADALPDAPRLAPLLYPGKIMCAGANYYGHMAEMGFPGITKDSQRLFFFFKPPRNAVVGEGDTVHMPLDTAAFDWEVELAVVIGRPARAVSVEEAMNCVAALTVGVDFSARDLNRAPDAFYKFDWVAGKAQETCCPLGPRLVPLAAIAAPQDLRLRLSVNGEPKQDESSADMIFPIAEQIATASRIATLDPGDVILTGTPAGVGVPSQTFLSVGDTVEAEIEGVGRLATTIQPPKTAAG